MDKICSNESKRKKIRFYSCPVNDEAYDELEHDLSLGKFLDLLVSTRVGQQCE